MQLTGQIVINRAYIEIGILEQGGAPSVSDSNAALDELNDMWEAWGIDEDLIPAEVPFQFVWAANTPSFAIGPNAGAPLNVPVPSRIYRAFFIDASGVRIQIEVVNADKYFAHRDLSAAAKSPDELYPDFNVVPATGSITLYAWPVPSAQGTLEINIPTTFTAWALGTNYNVPQGFADDIKYCLAWRLISAFGLMVTPEIAQNIEGKAMKSEARIIKMNAINRQRPLPPAQAMPPGEK